MRGIPQAMVEVFRSPTAKPCRERALVLKAIGIPFDTVQHAEGFSLVVDESDEARAVEQLRLYESENRGWPPPRETLYAFSVGTAGALAYAAILCAVYLFSLNGSWGHDWLAAGRLQAGAVRNGEWWRCTTALTLHLDLAHLAGNLFFGGLFGALLSQVVGVGVAWSAALLAGTLGNALNAWLQPTSHSAVGASTSVFAILGALAAFQWLRRRHLRLRAFQRWAPLVAAAVLLAWLGTSGERTDVLAHVTGFAAGAFLGVLLGIGADRMPRRPWIQASFGAVAALSIAAAWVAALT